MNDTDRNDPDRIVRDLNNVIAMDYDAIAAYGSAMERLDNAEFKGKLAEFLDDHRRHVSELGKVVSAHGGEPEDSGDFKQLLSQGRVVIADLAGDRAILKAMKSNQEQITQTYEDALGKAWPADIQKVLEQGLVDERRHRAWYEGTVERLDNQPS